MTAGDLFDFIHRWQTLIGVLLSGAITLFAASLAWRAVQRQIANQRAIASRAEDDAFTAIREGAAELYGMLNLVWRAVDVALANKSSKDKDGITSLVYVLRESLPNEKNLDSLVDVAQQLGPTKRRRFLLFANMVRSFYQIYSARREQPYEVDLTAAELEKQQKYNLLALRTYLTHAYKYLQAFDPDSAAIFADRVHTKVDHRMMHEHLESMVAIAERGERFLG